MSTTSIIDGIPNFRSLQGIESADGRRVRPGVLYRSEALVGLNETARKQIAELGISCFVDLRSPAEQGRDPISWPGVEPTLLGVELLPDARVAGVNLIRDLMSDTTGESVRALLLANARDMPRAFGRSMNRIFSAILEEGQLPMLVGCVAGKDRTGFVVSVILAALDVPRNRILEEFARTAGYLHPLRLHAAMMAWVDDVPDPLLSAEQLHSVSFLPEYAEASFAAIDDLHGSFENYLTEVCGLDASRREQLKNKLLV